MGTKNYVGYFRTSTKDQNLGIDSQKSIIASYIKQHNGELIKSFEEHESGKNNERHELKAALDYCKDYNATLVIAKLDRLSRSVSFLFALRDSGVNIECVDLPELNTLNLAIFAGMAQHERELISDRTSKALQAKIEAGFVLGKPENLSLNLEKAITKSKETRKAKALSNPNNTRAYAFIKSMRVQNNSWACIMRELNKAGFKTSTGKQFTVKAVQLVMDLFESNK
ncbi:recombinase family protein [uncultured Bacteroides sp.]|uniref:recombinase family protein n=1 Tax=uncultured Bacteroides sp. TaxID=162156 RepID=UPI002AAA62DD|nr:recombinase family protein [uncultured Bacteroides sp.]